MGKVYDGIDEKLGEFIRSQSLFFVASAPLAAAGHVNLSPKGLDSLRILGPGRVAYLDLVGSGAETLAHVRENGRIVLMFCAFEGPPRIVRLHGDARVVEPGEPEWRELAEKFPDYPSARSVIVVDVSRVADSCGDIDGNSLLFHSLAEFRLRDKPKRVARTRIAVGTTYKSGNALAHDG